MASDTTCETDFKSSSLLFADLSNRHLHTTCVFLLALLRTTKGDIHLKFRENNNLLFIVQDFACPVLEVPHERCATLLLQIIRLWIRKVGGRLLRHVTL